MASLRRKRLLLSLLSLVAALSLAAQTLGLRAFAGTVLDEQGQPLAGATVTILDLDGNQQRDIQTDNKGRFYYGGFHPGRYRVSVYRQGTVLWSSVIVLSLAETPLQLTVDLKKLRQAAERRQRLDPELERLRDAERERRQADDRRWEPYHRGVRRLNEGKPDLALEDFQASLQLSPNDGTTYGMLAAAYAAADRLPEAAAAYRHALELEPGEAAHHNNLGTVLVRSGQLEEALTHFEKAAQLDPARAATYHFNTGAALLNAGRAKEALPALRQATHSDPTSAVAHFFLGVALFRTSPRRPAAEGQERVEPRAGTIESFQRYLRLAPEGPYADAARDYLKQLGVAVEAAPAPASSGTTD